MTDVPSQYFDIILIHWVFFEQSQYFCGSLSSCTQLLTERHVEKEDRELRYRTGVS